MLSGRRGGEWSFERQADRGRCPIAAQTAVLGMHATKDKPWVVDNQIVIRPIMVVALTYDHRLLDGREGELRSRSLFPFPLFRTPPERGSPLTAQ